MNKSKIEKLDINIKIYIYQWFLDESAQIFLLFFVTWCLSSWNEKFNLESLQFYTTTFFSSLRYYNNNNIVIIQNIIIFASKYEWINNYSYNNIITFTQFFLKSQ